uniref:Uncharacterized protein n=1 Tax=Rhizophagus irregularis (strain DAOM 181602 / DAOM 197198 / MUCL 43194) TaxID=747089 RepID=U9TTS4_RHIID
MDDDESLRSQCASKWKDIMKSNTGNTKRNFLTQNEIEALLAAANTGAHATRNYCFDVVVLYSRATRQ